MRYQEQKEKVIPAPTSFETGYLLMIEYKSRIFGLKAAFFTFLLMLFIFSAFIFTPNFVENNLSPDGNIGNLTLIKIYLIRIGFFSFATMGLLLYYLFLFKPNYFELLRNQFSKIPLIVKFLLFIDLALCINFFFSSHLLSGQLFHFIDIGAEANIPTWYSSVKLFCISILAGVFAFRKFNRQKNRNYFLFLLPLLFLILSIDESASIHEWLGYAADFLILNISREETFFKSTGVWMFALGIPFFTFFLLIMYSIKDYIDRNNLLIILYGMIVFLSGAIGVETLENIFSQNYMFIQEFIEELLEMIGVSIIFLGFYNLADIEWHYVLSDKNDQMHRLDF
jgi:hypothetical protein